MADTTRSLAIDDPVNHAILAISEDQIAGFHRDPIGLISQRSGVELGTVIERLRVMLEAGVIRRIRQTLLATNLAHGALIAWRIDADRLNAAFDWMHERDPFTGHAVIRSTDPASRGAGYRLWTTLKVPQGRSLDAHCRLLAQRVGAEGYVIMPAKRLFKLGVGHVRRRDLLPGTKSHELADPIEPRIVELDPQQWRVLLALKRELTADEIGQEPWRARAAEAGVDHETFCTVAERLNELGVIGRFSTFLEHAKAVAGNRTVSRYNALFHWAVPTGREIEAGRQVGRFHILTHAYWREGGPAFGDVNVMAVAHGNDRERVLAHKQAIDDHLAAVGIPVGYTNVFWGGRSAIKPSEISPEVYQRWLAGHADSSAGAV